MSGRSMFEVSSLSNWDAATLYSLQDVWMHQVSSRESEDILRGLSHFKSLGSHRKDPSDFPMGVFESVLEKAVRECEYGLGVFLIRGLPIADLPESDSKMIAWGIGMHLGVPLIQNSHGEMVVNVRDSGQLNPLRGNSTNAEIEHHTDNCDIVTLLCRRSAMSGGESRIVSSVRAYNFMVKNYPDMATDLHDMFPFSDISNKDGVEGSYF
ncbi:MAG: TauD/TfdA family dioxygenase [Lautropia sp.]|nr:TauD/TfdA family dioxygenase [Lautropia sp.]